MKQRIQSIEFFRFVFANCVALWHLFAIKKIRHGYLPVEFFFILSGIWLYSAYQKGKETGQTAFQYTWARARRIYPLYLLSFIIVLPLTLHKLTNTAAWFNTIPELMLLQNSGFFLGGLNHPLWFLSALLLGGYLVYAMLEYWEVPSVKFFFPLIVLGTYTYIFSLGSSIEQWGVVGPFPLPLVRAAAGLCLGVCLYRLVTWAKERETRLSRLAINLFSLFSAGAIVFAIFYEPNLDRYCLILFCGILAACLMEHSWLNIVLRGSIWQRLGQYSMEMFMIHAAVVQIWKRIPWEPFGAVEKSLYALSYLVAVFLGAVIVHKLSELLRGWVRKLR